MAGRKANGQWSTTPSHRFESTCVPHYNPYTTWYVCPSEISKNVHSVVLHRNPVEGWDRGENNGKMIREKTNYGFWSKGIERESSWVTIQCMYFCISMYIIYVYRPIQKEEIHTKDGSCSRFYDWTDHSTTETTDPKPNLGLDILLGPCGIIPNYITFYIHIHVYVVGSLLSFTNYTMHTYIHTYTHYT